MFVENRIEARARKTAAQRERTQETPSDFLPVGTMEKRDALRLDIMNAPDRFLLSPSAQF
jgi:hypothetical protein